MWFTNTCDICSILNWLLLGTLYCFYIHLNEEYTLINFFGNATHGEMTSPLIHIIVDEYFNSSQVHWRNQLKKTCHFEETRV